MSDHPRRPRRTLEAPVVVAGDHQRVAVGKLRKEVVDPVELLKLADTRKIAGVDQHVAVGHVQTIVTRMRVGHDDEAHGSRGDLEGTSIAHRKWSAGLVLPLGEACYS